MAASHRTWRDTLDRKPGCRIPRYANFTPDLQRRLLEHTGCRNSAELARFFDMDVPAGVAIPPPPDYTPPDYRAYYAGLDLPEDAVIGPDGTCRVPAGYYHFTGFVHPLRQAQSVDDILAYPLRDHIGWPTEGLRERVEALHAEGRFVAGSVGHTYETSWQIRGYEEFLTDLMLRPEMAEALLERITCRNIITARATAEAGVDYLRLGDDVANQRTLMFPPELWRRLFKPRLARIIAAGRQINPRLNVWYHSDGNITDIVPDLIEIGVTILNPVQPECMDPREIHRRHGERLALDGAIGTQTVMPFQSAADVRATVRTMIRDLGREGGLILSPTHVLEPEVPLANVEAFFDACREYGNGR
ncbi:MAG: hypothetical protein JXR77_08840 [Lentisphaeria bacterium]|nr:hypothetical protein [Lentisphaeria bacterium]